MNSLVIRLVAFPVAIARREPGCLRPSPVVGDNGVPPPLLPPQPLVVVVVVGARRPTMRKKTDCVECDRENWVTMMLDYCLGLGNSAVPSCIVMSVVGDNSDGSGGGCAAQTLAMWLAVVAAAAAAVYRYYCPSGSSCSGSWSQGCCLKMLAYNVGG